MRSLLFIPALLSFAAAAPQRGIGGCGCREVICPNQGPDVSTSEAGRILERLLRLRIALRMYQRCGGRLFEISEGRLSAATGKNIQKDSVPAEWKRSLAEIGSLRDRWLI